jgi:hypothetical protein
MFIAEYDASALLSTAINRQRENAVVKVYPVPAQDSFFIEAYFGNPESGMIHILDISGREIFRESFKNEIIFRKKIPINNPSGILFVKISTVTENIVKKLIVQR